MSNKYRLVKEYPGSPKLGFILDKTWEVNYPLNCYLINGLTFNPNNHTEFWEQVVDYEILSLLGNDNKIIPYLTNAQCIEYLIKSGFKIYSVKRNDGEIFTVGDRIQYYNITGEKSHTHAISDITIYENKILLNHNHGTWKSHGDFNKVQKIKQLLFTTEDGVDIFDGDKFYYVKDFKLSNIRVAKQENTPNPANPKFKYKKNADEWLVLNTPCLSYGDIQPYLKVKDCNKVLQLVQSKL